jgi:hypothetical protein
MGMVRRNILYMYLKGVIVGDTITGTKVLIRIGNAFE